MAQVTVALPIRHAARTLERAFGAVAGQTFQDIEILLVLDGADPETAAVAHTLARSDSRARVLASAGVNLAAALNTALREAKAPLIARMDADDTCHPDRITRQVATMEAHPSWSALGTAFEVVDAATGRTLATRRPPLDPAELRWRLLLENVLCHGSMMLRRDAVLAAGGYDQSRERAQDYELWLRLNGLTGGVLGAPVRPSIGCLPDVLYTYYVESRGSYSSSSLQASAAGDLLANAWRALPRGMDGELPILLAEALGGSHGPAEAIEGIEESLRDAPATSSLIGWLWSRWFFPPMSSRAVDACRRSRLREVGADLRRRGATGVTLWGAGAHTGWLLEHREDLGIAVRGIVDDVVAGQDRFGFRVAPPGSVGDDDIVLLSSDWHEDALWAKASTLRERGVTVLRLYGS